MKTKILFSTITLLAGSLLAMDSTPKDEVTSAAKKLGGQANYTWKATVAVPEDAQFKPGPTDGKTEKNGFTHITMSFFDNPIQIALKGTNAAFTGQDGSWQSLQAASGDGPGQFMGMLIRNLQTPSEEAAELAGFAKELKKDGDAYSSDLTEEGAKAKLIFRRGGGGATVANPKGSVKFWLKDGALIKYEFKVKGTVTWNGNDFDNDRTTTVEIKDVGTTKVEVPADALKKFNPPPAPTPLPKAKE